MPNVVEQSKAAKWRKGAIVAMIKGTVAEDIIAVLRPIPKRLRKKGTGSRKWTESQQQRAKLLFERYPLIRKAYDLSIKLGDIFKNCTHRDLGFTRLVLWYNHLEDSGIDGFKCK